MVVLAVTVRLAGSLRGSGLYGLGNYDDGVHVAAALGLVNGLLPYRDFLLLHPPGVVLAMAPFAALSWLVGEPHAMAAARVAWMVLGGLNALLCGLVLRPLSRAAGLVAALFYALSIGAVYVEHTILLEPPATTVLLLALVITRLLGTGASIGSRHYLVAGLLLGFSPVLKIWGVIAVAVVVVTIFVRRGRHPGVLTLAGAAATCVAACLPFFVLAPQQMWQMVVLAQLGRRRANERISERLNDVLGVREWNDGADHWTAGIAIMLVLLGLATAICLVRAELRVIAALMITHGALVMTTPMWFLHYAGLTAAPMALTFGGALAAVLAWVRGLRTAPRARRWLPPCLVAAAVAGTVGLALPMRSVDLGDQQLPVAELAPSVPTWGRCVTTDWPMTWIQLDLLQTQIDRGCRFVVDLGGYSYYLLDSPYHPEARRNNLDWQAFALDYYRSGQAVIPLRFDTSRGFSRSTAETLDSWPVIIEADGYVVRRTEPAGS